MITLYSGTPGSGKSYHALNDIRLALLRKKHVITNIAVDIKKISRKGKRTIGTYKYFDALSFKPIELYKHAHEYHKKGKENQTLLVVDECQLIFNSRDWQKKERSEWVLFFTRHRHLGYNVILLTQFDRFVDRQIRGLFEYEIKHRKVNNFGPFVLLPFTVFILIEYWYGSRTLISKNFMRFKPRLAKLYDSYVMYDEFTAEFKKDASEQTANIEPMLVSGCDGVGVPVAPTPGVGFSRLRSIASLYHQIFIKTKNYLLVKIKYFKRLILRLISR